MSEYFKKIPKIKYEGKGSDNPLAFKYYDPDLIINGKTLKEHLKFSVAFWHTFQGTMSDPFGPGTAIRPWDSITDPMELAHAKIDAAFEFFDKLQVPFFCFHDRDIAPEADTLKQTNKNLYKIAEYIKEKMNDSDVKLLWGTTNAFSHPRFVHGAATSCNADVFAYAAAQVKNAIDITKFLGGENYVFWGGREGYETLLNTDMKLELDNLGRFFEMAVDYAKRTGFSGQFLIEPKPKEPTKHQYDFDAASVISFFRSVGLLEYFKLNIEANHATLATHTFNHELRLARINNMLGSIDANQGDLLLGWDTDQFPTNIYDSALAMYEVIKNGGLGKGGLNFDARPRRASFEPEDLYISHIAGMDTFAIGYLIADKMIKDGKIDKFINERYASYRTGIGEKIVAGKTSFEELESYALDNPEPVNQSGRQEMLEAVLNGYIY